jgi:hypothetical protein
MRYRRLFVTGAVCALASSAHAFTDCAGIVRSVSANPNWVVVTLESGLSFGVSIAPEKDFSKMVSALVSTAMLTQGRITVRFDQSGLDCSRAKDRTDVIALTFAAVQWRHRGRGLSPNLGDRRPRWSAGLLPHISPEER